MPVFAVVTEKGTNWDHDRGIREQPFFPEHAAFADQLVEKGVVILGGPVGMPDSGVIALLAVDAADEEALYPIFDDDPWTVHHVFRLREVWPWAIWLDGRA